MAKLLNFAIVDSGDQKHRQWINMVDNLLITNDDNGATMARPIATVAIVSDR